MRVPLAILTVLAFATLPAHGQGIRPAVQNAARCATTATSTALPSSAPRIVGAQDTTPRGLFGTRDLLIISAGVAQGAHVGQQYVIRRRAAFGDRRADGPRALATAGGLRIIAANDTTAIAQVEFACDGIFVGDYLEPAADLPLPEGLDRTETPGEPDFTRPARLLFGENERETGAIGDFMVMAAGSRHGMTPGARLAVYRDVELPQVPLAWVGEAVAVRVDEGTAVVRITYARDAVRAGDLLFTRK